MFSCRAKRPQPATSHVSPGFSASNITAGKPTCLMDPYPSDWKRLISSYLNFTGGWVKFKILPWPFIHEILLQENHSTNTSSYRGHWNPILLTSIPCFRTLHSKLIQSKRTTKISRLFLQPLFATHPHLHPYF